LLTCTHDGEVTYVNRAAELILGRSTARRPAHVDELIPDALSMHVPLRRHELAVDTPLGRRILGLTITPLDGGGSLLIVFQDLTELRRVEDELRRADRLASLGSLAAQLAHEIRNPLASMRGSAQMLAQDALEGSAARRLTTILVRESDRLAALVDSVLQFARPPPPTLATIELGALVAETVEMIRADPMARGVQLEATLDAAVARADGGQLRQVVLNLVRNALEAAGERGRVRVGLQSGTGVARIRVWDSGGSIPPADLDRVFEPFFTTRVGGTGLGLSTAHSIVRAHRGKISVTSSPASGTEFVVELPMAEEARVASDGGR
jgi:two-component system sensor histidine kinase PilS (NtrC family)